MNTTSSLIKEDQFEMRLVKNDFRPAEISDKGKTNLRRHINMNDASLNKKQKKNEETTTTPAETKICL
jgi:hypothetical protein